MCIFSCPVIGQGARDKSFLHLLRLLGLPTYIFTFYTHKSPASLQMNPPFFWEIELLLKCITPVPSKKGNRWSCHLASQSSVNVDNMFSFSILDTRGFIKTVPLEPTSRHIMYGNVKEGWLIKYDISSMHKKMKCIRTNRCINTKVKNKLTMFSKWVNLM